MKTYFLHHAPKSASQDCWALSFSLPYIASRYARAGDGVWYVQTWLTADQIKARLAILFDSKDELTVHELSRKDVKLTARLSWMAGRLEEDDIDAAVSAPRVMWDVLQSAVQTFVGGQRGAMGATIGNSRAA